MLRRTPPFVIGALVSTFLLVGIGFGDFVTAQEMEPGDFPAHIHNGTCDELDPAPEFPLDPVHHGVIAKLHGDTDAVVDAVRSAADRAKELAELPFEEAKRLEMDVRREHPDVIPVHVSETTVDVSLDDLLASPHAINVHESEENVETYIACGNITGTPEGRNLSVPMMP